MRPEDIDKLFRNKLENHRLEPSADLFAKLQSRLQPEEEKKKTRPLWLFYAAASVSVLLLSVALWLGYSGKGAGTAETVAIEQPKQTENQKQTAAGTEAILEVPATDQLASQAPAETQEAEPSEKAPVSEKRFKNAPLPASQNKQLAKQQAQPKQKLVQPERELVAVNNNIAAPKSTEKPEQKTLKQAEQELLARQESSELLSAPIEVNIIKGSEATAVALVNQAPQEADEQRRPLFQRLIKQAVNLTQGEQVNLEELKLNRQIALETQIGNHKVSKVINL